MQCLYEVPLKMNYHMNPPIFMAMDNISQMVSKLHNNMYTDILSVSTETCLTKQIFCT